VTGAGVQGHHVMFLNRGLKQGQLPSSAALSRMASFERGMVVQGELIPSPLYLS